MGNKKRLRPHTKRGMERRRRGNKKPRAKSIHVSVKKIVDGKVVSEGQ
jgi:hypothetical protein